jgi:hypothetical protein
MEQHLEYFWFFGLLHRGAAPPIWKNHIHEEFKAILAYGRPPLVPAKQWVGDLVRGAGMEKALHEWQQGLPEAEHIIRHLTDPGAFVVDPFAGSGTIPLACRKNGRRWLATEIDPARAAVARHRLATRQPDAMPLFEDEAAEASE